MGDRRFDARNLIDQFEPANGDLTAKAAFLDLLGGAADPFDQTQVTPGHLTASGFVLSPDGSALLLIHHRRLDMWLQPGGHVEPVDADLCAAARREIAEETLVESMSLAHTGVFDLDVHPIPGRSGMPAHHHFDASFLFRADDWAMEASGEVLGARWVALDEAKTLSNDKPLARLLDWLDQ